MHALNLFFGGVFIAINAVLSVVLPPKLSILKRLALLGCIAALSAGWSWVYYRLPRPFATYIPAAAWEEFHIRAGVAAITLLFCNFFCAVVIPALVRGVARFNTTFNRSNIHKEPLRTFMNNIPKVEMGYRLFFFAGSVLMFYGIWTDPKVID